MPNSKNLDTSSLPPAYSPKHPTLHVENLGHVPAFKNTKSIAMNRRTKKPFIMTNPRKKEWMEKAVASFESQLRFILATRVGATPTALYPRSLIASLVPLDDSRQWIPSQHVECVEVEPGKEGAVITLEPI